MTGPGTNYLTMIDIREAEMVQVKVSEDGQTLWVNVDGICCLRVQRLKSLHVAGVVYR